ncbi:Fanconi anemia group C protein isoform X2 [Corythoichthys intestinalis]|uniref:Fanconi anemia group C protein isoform X2 n=1 Tax=Corythoichthys intestinalis TaxID=161448 RepID=UPI0025A53E26|nr:Fanconi anemia group C protein isoform X2 [Corythoichthys intestinalis]
MSQSVVQIQPTEMQLWLDKVEAWGRTDILDVQKDACFHLTTLRDFLQRLLMHINCMSSTTEIMKKMPSLGQLLGRLCWNPVVTADDNSRLLIFQCLWQLYSENPVNALEKKANQWIQKLVCQLATEGEDKESPSDVLLKHLNVPPTQYHLEVLSKVVARLQEDIGKKCNSLEGLNERCSCDRIVATSEACIPLVTCREVAPLIGALLERPFTCAKATLSHDFLNALSTAYTSGCLSLEDRTVMALWYHSLPSLEEAALGLLESTVLTDTPLSPQQLERQIDQSLLPKACAQHCSIFLLVNDIFRAILKKQGQPRLRDLIQSFTSCFYRELTLLQTQMPLKAFFPHSPQNLLLPLLSQPPEASREARRRHLNWLSDSLRRLTEEEEEAAGSGGEFGVVFEAWFLLVQCSQWVQEVLQVLISTEPSECHPLLWLLTFYYHPSNREHHRNQRLVCVQQVWEQLRLFFSPRRPPLDPEETLGSVLALVSPSARPPSPAPLLILNLAVSGAVFSDQWQRDAALIVRKVATASGLVTEASRILSSLERLLGSKSGNLSSGDPDAASVRIRRLQEALGPGLR